jgi:hypothetical protein
MTNYTNASRGFGHFQANPGNSPQQTTQQPVEYVPPCQLDGCRANAWFDVRTNTYSNACTLKHRAEINQQNRAQSGVPGSIVRRMLIRLLVASLVEMHYKR